FDTCSLLFTLQRDIPLHIAYTHACSTNVDPIISSETDSTLIRYVAGRHIEIQPLAGPADGNREVLPLVAHPHGHMFRAFQHCVRNPTSDGLCAALEMARVHVEALNVVSEHTSIVDIPREFIETLPGPGHAPLRAVRDLVPAMQQAIADK